MEANKLESHCLVEKLLSNLHCRIGDLHGGRDRQASLGPDGDGDGVSWQGRHDLVVSLGNAFSSPGIASKGWIMCPPIPFLSTQAKADISFIDKSMCRSVSGSFTSTDTARMTERGRRSGNYFPDRLPCWSRPHDAQRMPEGFRGRKSLGRVLPVRRDGLTGQVGEGVIGDIGLADAGWLSFHRFQCQVVTDKLCRTLLVDIDMYWIPTTEFLNWKFHACFFSNITSEQGRCFRSTAPTAIGKSRRR